MVLDTNNAVADWVDPEAQNQPRDLLDANLDAITNPFELEDLKSRVKMEIDRIRSQYGDSLDSPEEINKRKEDLRTMFDRIGGRLNVLGRQNPQPNTPTLGHLRPKYGPAGLAAQDRYPVVEAPTPPEEESGSEESAPRIDLTREAIDQMNAAEVYDTFDTILERAKKEVAESNARIAELKTEIDRIKNDQKFWKKIVEKSERQIDGLEQENNW